MGGRTLTEQLQIDSMLEKVRPYLRLLAQAHLGDQLKKKVDASDLVQQTLLEAYQDREKFRGSSEAQLVAWLKRILQNRLIDMARHRKVQKRDQNREIDLAQQIEDSFRQVRLVGSVAHIAQHGGSRQRNAGSLGRCS